MTLPSERPPGKALRRRWRHRWVAALAMAAVCALTFSLGQWQLRRAQEKIALHLRAEQALRATPVELSGQRVEVSAVNTRAVAVEGSFMPQGTVFIDNRTHQGVAGFFVLTPVRIRDSALHVLVLRGWVAREVKDRNRLPVVATPSDTVRIVGIAEADLPRTMELKSAPMPGPDERLWQNLDLAVYQQWSGLSLQPFLIRQSPASAIPDNLVRQWRVAGGDVDKHRAYALQWFVMSAAAAIVTIFLLVVSRRES